MKVQQGKPIKIGPFSTSSLEINNLLKAWVAISAAFGIVLAGSLFSAGFIVMLVISAFTVGIAFLAHEISHKLVAQHYGCFAEFRSFDQMLILAVIMSFFGFVFAAPGAVMISGPVGRRRNGIISAAGPSMNLILGSLFFVGYILMPSVVFFYGYLINTILALFNMIPIWNFDGKKILAWSKAYYALMAVVGVALILGQTIAG